MNIESRAGGNELLDNVGTGDTEETDPDSDSETVPLVYNPAINVTKAVAAVDAAGNGLADAEGDKAFDAEELPAQAVGMLDAWGDHAAVRDTLSEASQALGELFGMVGSA
mgnify:CR=1 FL=1